MIFWIVNIFNLRHHFLPCSNTYNEKFIMCCFFSQSLIHYTIYKPHLFFYSILAQPQDVLFVIWLVS